MREPVARLPANLFEGEGAGLAFKAVNAEENQQNGQPLGIAIFVSRYLASDYGCDAKLFPEFPFESLPRGLPVLDLSAGKLPLELVRIARLALADENVTVLLDHSGDDDQWPTHVYQDSGYVQ